MASIEGFYGKIGRYVMFDLKPVVISTHINNLNLLIVMLIFIGILGIGIIGGTVLDRIFYSQKFKRRLDRINTGIAIVKENGKPVFVNRYFKEILSENELKRKIKNNELQHIRKLEKTTKLTIFLLKKKIIYILSLFQVNHRLSMQKEF